MAAGSGRARSLGAAAEAAAKRKFGLVTDNTAAHDLRHPENGYVYSVKACRTENNRGGPGRFRIWEDSHKRFMGQRGAYIFVVYNGDTGNIWKVEKVPQSVVDELVAGNWYASGHDQKGRQVKITWRDAL